MINNDKHFHIKDFAFYLESSLKGALAGTMSFIVSYPFEVVKTKLQSEGIIERRKAIKLSINLMKNEGITGFYKGCVPGILKFSLRNVYRWPLMLYLPAFFNSFVSPTKSKICTAITLGNFEALFFAPLERIKIFLITQQHRGRHPLLEFLKANHWTELFRGLKPYILKQNSTWLSFLYFDYLFKKKGHEWKDKRTGISNSNLSFLELNIISFMVALCNTTCVIPFDYVKTSSQKESYIEIKSITKFLYNSIKTYGIRSIFPGWQVKMFHYTIQAIFNVNLLYSLENKSNKKSNA